MFYTKSWTRRQQRLFGSKDPLITEKVLDLTNIGVGSLFFGQFLSQQINMSDGICCPFGLFSHLVQS